MLGMGHQSDDAAVLAADTSDARGRAVRVGAGVARHHLASLLDPTQRGRVRHIRALTALEHQRHLLAGRIGPGPAGGRVLHPHPDLPADEAQATVTSQRARQQVRLAENLEAIADAEHRQAGPGRGHQPPPPPPPPPTATPPPPTPPPKPPPPPPHPHPPPPHPAPP